MKKNMFFSLVFAAAVLLAGCNKSSEPAQPIDPDLVKCGLESCHGMDITCGANVPDICTEEYQIGDFCREYAICEVIGNDCQFQSTTAFEACKSCVEQCLTLPSEEAAACESQCRAEIM